MSDVTKSNISSDSSFDSTVSTVINLVEDMEIFSSAVDHRQLRGGQHYLFTTVKKQRQKWISSCATQQLVIAIPPAVVVNPQDWQKMLDTMQQMPLLCKHWQIIKELSINTIIIFN